MVNATQYVDQTYNASTRVNITELDLSNKNLEGQLYLITLGFINLRKLNVSYNRINGFNLPESLEEFDCSHNQISYFTYSLPKARKFNISNNVMTNFSLDAPFLSYLDLSINSLQTLDLRSLGGENVIELNCSNNPLTSLSLNYSSNLISFDCLGMKYNKFQSSPTQPSPIQTSSIQTSPTQDSYPFITTTALANNNPALMGSNIALSAIIVVALLSFGSYFVRKHLTRAAK
ncbi:1422_t:CDS:1 [Racocetra fulgida]|uniref:1422_t:CDS:1 n=1 Tax=Racocetra fulgida TaxID=60492 RepID=A0A9N9EBR5_9GLOM|nr:1422_t:CDS:1 [Racocetra fulgida]